MITFNKRTLVTINLKKLSSDYAKVEHFRYWYVLTVETIIAHVVFPSI